MGQDVSNFDTVFTEEDPIDSFVEDSNLSKTVQDQFSGTTHDIRQQGQLMIFSCRLFLQRH